MNALLRKEVRLVLPLWLVAIVLVIVTSWVIAAMHPYDPSSIVNAVRTTVLFGALMLGLTPFGLEFSSGTFQQLLSQPVARERLWWRKVIVQIAALFSLVLCGLICVQFAKFGNNFDPDALKIFLVTSACWSIAAVAGGLWTTLLFRQIAAALWFSILVPLVIGAGTTALAEKILQPRVDSSLPDYCAYAAVLLYALAGFLWARHMFLGAQDTQWTGGTISLPAWFKTRKQARSVATIRKPLGVLFGKELQAQHVSLLLAAVLLILHLLAIGLRKVAFAHPSNDKIISQLLGFWWCLWLIMPVLVGGAAVAEERKHGTLESQLCLPVPRWLQFGIKLGCVLGLGFLLGGVMPWVLESLATLLGFPGEFDAVGGPWLWEAAELFCLVSLSAAFIAFYASSLTRNLLQAMGAAVILWMVFAGLSMWALNGAPINTTGTFLWFGSLVKYIGLPTLIAVTLWLSFRNFKTLLPGWNTWLGNCVTLSAAIAGIILSTMLISNRSWEWFMRLEPRHGPSRLAGTVRPQICSMDRPGGWMSGDKFVLGQKIFVLLPDGRLWTATEGRPEKANQKIPIDSGRQVRPYVLAPTNGIFLGGSNWVQLASNWSHFFGLRNDGSLWKLFSLFRTNVAQDASAVPALEQIGTDVDWKTVVSGGTHFLMLKRDGSLWGWGRNESGQLGPGPKAMTNALVQIGRDTDWLTVFAAGWISVGVKRDGSVWQWGEVPIYPTIGRWTKQSLLPERASGVQGEDWRKVVSVGPFYLILKSDGSLWAWGNVASSLFGHHLFESQQGFTFCEKPVRIGKASDWSEIASDYRTFIGLKRDGAIIQSQVFPPRLVGWGDTRSPSRYSDWVAVSSHAGLNRLAMAADGTLSAWEEFDPYRTLEKPLLGPTRRPLWSFNLLAKP